NLKRRTGDTIGWCPPHDLSADPVRGARLPGCVVSRTERDQRVHQPAQPPRVGARASPGGAPAEDRLHDRCDHGGQSERKELREYGGSDKPRGAAAYRIDLLARDAAELIVALGHERADLVGHDWGAHIAWHVAMWDPRRVRRLAILNVPHPERMRRGLRTLRQLRKSWYMLFFQLPVLPECSCRRGGCGALSGTRRRA